MSQRGVSTSPILVSSNNEKVLMSDQKASDAELEWDENGTQLSDEENDCRLAEKRQRQDSSEDKEEDEFIKVTHRRPKRLARSFSTNNKQMEQDSSDIVDTEVCMTAKEMLPKQIALAKKLMLENINNILKIKYKNPYKVFIRFETAEDAKKLLHNKNIADLGYRCQLTHKLNFIYGVVKEMDLEESDEDLMKNIKSEAEIISVRRLKRKNYEGEWVESESVRFCFKGSTLPPYVRGYGCRFEVEPYIFPVTQCSNCWKFGHLMRQCPTKKVLCPKCGGQHANCDTTNYKCINCKGNHISLYKRCPVYLKERQIRVIMSQDNCTYKVALNKYLTEIQTEECDSIVQEGYNGDTNLEDTQPILNKKPSYRDIVLTKAIVHREMTQQEPEVNSSNNKTNKPSRKKNKKRNNLQDETMFSSDTETNMRQEPMLTENEEKKNKRERKFNFMSTLGKIKDIILTEKTWEEKIQMLVKICVNEVKNFIMEMLKSYDWFNTITNTFNNE